MVSMVSMVPMVSMVSSTRALAVVGELAGVDAVRALAHGLHAGVVAAMIVVFTPAVAVTVPVAVTKGFGRGLAVVVRPPTV